ncbi:MAG: hypothetical protein HC833_00765 [Leptolyngbyaceae cyanobacterium RM1_406_9]|nr:hypothetical protein [Leptolyngbyaceae cyanobacterium SM1_4_3]NJO72426.1 hypothetical protein [Leptolyngbyaceae cyanobacterium RM1_406_9]
MVDKTQLGILQAAIDAEEANPSIAITEHHIAERVNLDLHEIRANLKLMERRNCVRLQDLSTHDGDAVWVKIMPEGHMALRGRNEFLNNTAPTGIRIKNLLQVENAHSSQFQQGTHNSTQNLFVDGTTKTQLNELLAEIKALASNLEFDQETQDDLQSDIQTVEAQLSNSKPKNTILKSAFLSISSILKGSVEKAISAEMASHIPSIIHRIHTFIQNVN